MFNSIEFLFVIHLSVIGHDMKIIFNWTELICLSLFIPNIINIRYEVFSKHASFHIVFDWQPPRYPYGSQSDQCMENISVEISSFMTVSPMVQFSRHASVSSVSLNFLLSEVCLSFL